MNDYIIERKCEMCLDWTNNEELYSCDAPEEHITLINKGEIIVCKACIEVINEYKDLQR